MKAERNNSLFYFPGNLAEVFKIRKKILGKVDLQKTVYFMKRLGVPIPFNFRWNILGPYSYDLAHYCSHLVVEGLLQYSKIYTINEEKAKAYVSNLQTSRGSVEGFFRRIEEICNTRSYDFVSFIECAASLDFILMNAPEKYRRKEPVYSLLDRLKPEKTELFRTFREDAWNLLVTESLI